MPGTPTSTTTSLSALSTTAIKDGHRGHCLPGPNHRGHHHNPSTNSLEAERADRISRLAGLSSVSTLRAPPGAGPHSVSPGGNPLYLSSQTTPTSSGFPALGAMALTPAYFDATGQPVAATKMSTVGTASATDDGDAHTTTMGEDQDMADADGDEDVLSMDTNYRDRDTGEIDSVSGYIGLGGGLRDIDPLDDRSVGTFEDRMSDDGNASLVGFGEGAGSTVSGPIYRRRPIPGQQTNAGGAWGLERSSSGLSDGAILGGGDRDGAGGGSGYRRDTVRGLTSLEGGGDIPSGLSAAIERRNARMVDGVATDGADLDSIPGPAANPEDDVYVDTTNRSPVPIHGSTIRERQQHRAQPPMQYRGSTSREAAERIIRERLDNGEARVGNTGMGSPKGESREGRLGRFYFEERSK